MTSINKVNKNPKFTNKTKCQPNPKIMIILTIINHF